MKNFLLHLPRNIKRLILIVVDFFTLSIAVWISFVIRSGNFFDPSNGYDITNILPSELYTTIFAAPLITIPVLIYFRLYRSITRYITSETFIKIFYALIISGVVWSSIFLMLNYPIPRLIYPTYIFISISFVCYTRFNARNYLLSRKFGDISNELIYSTDPEAKQISDFLKLNPKLNPIGFISTERSFHNDVLSNLPVIQIDNVENIIKKKNVKEILIPSKFQNTNNLKYILKRLHSHKNIIRKLPNIEDLITGNIQITDFQKIDIKDLLGRETIKPDAYLLKSCIENKTVLVTGAGGSIGSELARQIIALKPKLLILFEQSEYFLYKVENELKNFKNIDDSKLKIYLGSVSDETFTKYVFSTNNIDTVYHAAACKHVPLIENNPLAAINTNIVGTHCVANAAIDNGVKNFIFVSSDKAVRPTNIMGATKRFSEIILQSLQEIIDNKKPKNNIKFCVVRFGNVLDTSGSVIPLFREQISKGGPITVTDPEIIRYFMTIEEAVELVIQAGSLSEGGEVYLLNMGEPVKVLDLAKDMIKLSGNKIKDVDSNDGIEIIFTGLRPGEKMYEELMIGNTTKQTLHKDIICAIEGKISYNEVLKHVSLFKNLKPGLPSKDYRLLLKESISCDDLSTSKKIIDINKNIS